MESKTILDEYINFHNEYSKKYGENTIVLMEVGSFYEIYAVMNRDINIGPDIYHVCQNILQISVSKRNKKIQEISHSNYLLGGFPSICISKYESILLNHNYTVVIVEHITPPPNPERAVTRVVSPGTSLDNYNKQDSHYLMSLYIERIQKKERDVFLIGVSAIDLSTGKNYVHTIQSRIEDSNYWNDEISRYIHFYNPCEIIFHTRNYELTKDIIIQYWDINHDSIQINHYSLSDISKLSFQNEFLQNVFTFETLMTPIVYLDLERDVEAVISYICLLQYVHDHRAETLHNIELPEKIKDNNYLCLTSNSIRQLNVIHNYSYFKGKNESLLSVCNQCVTSMGRRLLKDRLLYPSLHVDVIKKRYDMIDFFSTNELYNDIHKDLKRVSDLEKSLRKMGLHLLKPAEFFSDSLSFEYITNVIETLEDTSGFFNIYPNSSTLITYFKDFNEYVYSVFNFENFGSSNLQRSMFHPNVFPELDILDSETQKDYEILGSIQNRLSHFLDSSVNSVKLDYDEKLGWHLYCTNKRAITFQERLTNISSGHKIHVKDKNETIIHSFLSTQFTFRKKDKSSTIIHTDYIKQISSRLKHTQHRLIQLNNESWDKIIHTLYTEHGENLKEFYLLLADIDFYCCGAKLSIHNKYVRPQIQESDLSFCHVKGIRHPIVEKIHTDTEYVTNDIQLGNKHKSGLLLFGTNACGKSTFMKSIGLNIILAQAGLYVAADEFIYKPYTQLFTRILNNDNIFRSQSSFAVEIQELKSILSLSDSSSLILGDELCSGTETISALSIIATGLQELCSRKSTFIFTSHLHQLTTLDEVKSLDNLDVKHLKIDYNKDTNVLTYDRKLTPGSGPSIYGLKVCEAMGMSSDFISRAKQMQNKLEENSDICSTKTSHYNSDIILNHCEICESKENLETHHIKDQQYADKYGMIDHHHKNIKSNLVPLCSQCHLKVTNYELIVRGWKETSKGRILDWEHCSHKTMSRKQFSEKDIIHIKNTKKNHPSLSQTELVKHLELHESIKLSVTTLRKILTNSY